MVLSSHSNQYIFVLYNYDTNSIRAHLLKKLQALEITTDCKTCHEHLRQNGASPTLRILNNECYHTMQKAFRKYNVDFQLVPPCTLRRNAAEREIRTFKDHLCARLASCKPNFPSQEWDSLIPQAVITLNLLQSSHTNSSLSAHASINRNFDFNANPLAPPDTK